MELLDLHARHGRNEVLLHDFFSSTEEASIFLNDVALNDLKSIKQISSRGNQKKWECEGASCTWSVTLSVRRGMNMEVTKLSAIPTGSWYFSSMQLTHGDLCDAMPVCSVRQIRGLRGFQAAIVEGRQTSFLRVVESVKCVDKLDLSGHKASVYRAIAAEITERIEKVEQHIGYDTLVSFLKKFEQLNPGSRTCCQLDSKGRFFRAFIAVGSVMSELKNLLPVFEIDGTHMKTPLYNGVCLTILSKDGNKGNMLVALAFVPKETKWHFAWTIANCRAAGIQFSDVALFSDRGKQLGAQRLLSRIGIHINLKFCSLHIVFNVCDRFKSVDPEIKRVKPFVFKLQACTSRRGYEFVLSEIRSEFPSALHADTDKEEFVSDYLRRIHLTSWSRFGNSSHDDEDKKYLDEHWSSIPSYGKPTALLGIRTTSGAEGENNALLWNGMRSKQVLGALVQFCTRILAVTSEKERISATWMNAKHDVTPKVMNLYSAELRAASMLSLTRGPLSEYLVVQKNWSEQPLSDLVTQTSRSFRVNVNSLTCTRCPTRELILIPCRHLIAAIYQENKIIRDVNIAPLVRLSFHPAYTVSAYRAVFSGVGLIVPIESELDTSVTMCPPPLYRQAGRSIWVRKPGKDRAQYTKRFPSRGELHSASELAQHNDSIEGTAENEMMSAMKGMITAATAPVRAPYTYGGCGITGHNIRRCPNKNKQREAPDEAIEPGWILLYIGEEN